MGQTRGVRRSRPRCGSDRRLAYCKRKHHAAPHAVNPGASRTHITSVFLSDSIPANVLREGSNHLGSVGLFSTLLAHMLRERMVTGLTRR
jgi:hypothetical protein